MKASPMVKNFNIAMIIAGIFLSSIPALSQNELIKDQKTHKELLNYLESICQWAIDSDLKSGELKITAKRRTSVFINSNLARILVAGYDLTGKQEYLDEAIRWFDLLVELQQPATTADGKKAGWWGDFSPDGNIYFGDAGTSATALAGVIRYVDGERRDKYMNALELYANFVRFGSDKDPQDKGRSGSNGWIIQDGEEKGAVGCGYYRNELSEYPYTISTSVTGAAFFSCMYELTGNNEYQEIAENAVKWLLKKRTPFGEFLYILHQKQLDEWPLDTMSYVADGVVGAYMRSNNQEFKTMVEKQIARSVQWLLVGQNKDGVWGELRSEDQQRSQGVLNLIVWYYHDVTKYKEVKKMVQANYNFFLDADNSKAFGVKELPITTGFVGLGIAEVLEPGVTYRLK